MLGPHNGKLRGQSEDRRGEGVAPRQFSGLLNAPGPSPSRKAAAVCPRVFRLGGYWRTKHSAGMRSINFSPPGKIFFLRRTMQYGPHVRSLSGMPNKRII